MTASGQTAPGAEPSEPIEVTEIVVRGAPSTDGELRNTATVTQEEIMGQNAGSVVDAVRSAPGVSIQQTTPGQGTIYVRGLSGRAIGHMVDGVRLNTAFYRAGNNPYLGLVDPYSLRQIVVEPGATSVEYGSDALGGAVLMSTPTPSPRGDPSAAPLPPTARIFQSFGSNPLGHRSHAEVTSRFARAALSVGLTYIRDRDVSPGDDALSPDPASYVGLERAASSEYQPRWQGTQLGTSYEFFGANATVQQDLAEFKIITKAQLGLRPTLVRYDRLVPLFKEDIPARYQAESAPMSRGMVSVSLRHFSDSRVYRWSELLLAWQGVGETNLERRYVETCLDKPEPLDDAPCATRQRLDLEAKSTGEDNRSDALTFRSVTNLAFGPALNLRLGLDAHVDRVGSRAWETDLTTAETVERASRFADGASLSEGGLFAKMAFRWGSLAGYAGARAMGFFIALPEQPGHGGYERGLFDYSASLGLRYALAEGAAVMANLGRGVRVPNVADLSGLGARAQGRFQLPSYELSPEHSYTVDLGARLQRRWLTLSTFVFGSRYADAIILAESTLGGQAFTPSGDRYTRSENAARIDYLGLDVSLRVHLSTRSAVFGRYLAMQGTETNPPDSGRLPQTPADRVPPYQGELGVELPVGPQLDIELWGRFRAAQRRLNDPINLEDNRIPAGGTPGYATLHVRAVYQVTPSLEAFARIDNLTNALVLDHGSGFYGPGLSAALGVSLNTER